MLPETSPRLSLQRPEASGTEIFGFHVALDMSLARRAPDGADEFLVNGFLLLDCGGYELCTVRFKLPLFWQMKAMDMFGATRQAAEQARDAQLPPAGSVWQVEARVPGCAFGNLSQWNGEGGPKGFEHEDEGADDGTERILHLEIDSVIALERIWIGANGPKLFEAYDAAALLPGAR